MQRFDKILVSIQADAPSSIVLNYASNYAERYDAELTLMDVIREFGWLKRLANPSSGRMIEEFCDKAREQLEEIASGMRERGIKVDTFVSHGKTSEEVTRQAIRGDYDLVMRGAKGAGNVKGFFGVTGMKLMRVCPCPVCLIRPGPHKRLERIVASVDVTSYDDVHAKLNDTILNLGSSIAERHEGNFDVVHAWSIYGESVLRQHMRPEEFEKLVEDTKADLAKLFDQVGAKYGLTHDNPRVHLLQGDPGQVIPFFIQQHEADLLVMGTVGRGGIARALMGNTAEQILDRVECSVLAVKPEDFQSPVKA